MKKFNIIENNGKIGKSCIHHLEDSNDNPFRMMNKLSDVGLNETISFSLKGFSEFKTQRIGGEKERKPLEKFFNIFGGIVAEKIIHTKLREMQKKDNNEWFVCDKKDDILMHEGNFDSTDLVVKSSIASNKINISVKAIKGNASFSMHPMSQYTPNNNSYYKPAVNYNKNNPYQEHLKPEFFDLHLVTRIGFIKEGWRYPKFDFLKEDFFKKYKNKSFIIEEEWKSITNELKKYTIFSDHIKYLKNKDFMTAIGSKHSLLQGSLCSIKRGVEEFPLFNLDANNYYILYRDYDDINLGCVDYIKDEIK